MVSNNNSNNSNDTSEGQNNRKDTIQTSLITLRSSINHFIADREGKGRETAVKGTSMDKLSDVIESAIRDTIPNVTILKGRKACVPGYYRPSKNWDIVVKRNSTILAIVELKSLTRAHGNNFNNRVEESLGNVLDVQKYYLSQKQLSPFIGYLMIMDESESSTKTRRICKEKGILEKFKDTGYLRRAQLFCSDIVKDELYDTAQVITFSGEKGVDKLDTKGFNIFLTKLLFYLESLKET